MKFDLPLRAHSRRLAGTRKPSPRAAIETLEPRIAPAAVNPLTEVPNPGDLKIQPGLKTAFYHDLDNDIFLIKTTKGAFSDGLGANPNRTFLVDGAGIIERIDLSLANFQTLVKGVPVANFQGAAVSAKVIAPTKANGLPLGGDGRMDVGYVNATGVDLGSVAIPGDLTRIDAGDVNDKTTALGTLAVQSMGALGLTTQASLAGSAAVQLTSNIHGRLGALRVLGAGKAPIPHNGMQDVFIDVTAPDIDPKTGVANPKLGTIGSASIDALIVTNNHNAVFAGLVPTYTPGTIRASGPIGAVSVGYSVAGGNADYSGAIWSRTSITSVTMSGKALPVNPPAATLTGGAGFDSGAIFAGNPDTGAPAGKLGVVKINKVAGVAGSGNILGGAGINSATLYGDAGITSVYLGGDLQGGPVAFSGAIVSGTGAGPGVGVGQIGPVTVKGSILGSVGTNSGSLESAAGITSVLVYGNQKGGTGDYSGSIVALNGNVRSITIKGELDTDPGAARDKTGIFVDGVLGSLLVGRINPGFGPGNVTQYGAIVARGPVDKAGNVVPGNAIGGILVGTTVAGAIVGGVNFFHIAAGFDHFFDSNNAGIPGARNNPDASIGAVTIYGGVFATSITAGTSWGPDNNPGPDLPIGANPTTNDAPLPFGQSVARIASIVVRGAVTAGDVNTGNNTIFEAGSIGTVTIGGATAPGFGIGGPLRQIQLFSHAYLVQITG